jgi:membrane protease YdiL (CAAX protease family)
MLDSGNPSIVGLFMLFFLSLIFTLTVAAAGIVQSLLLPLLPFNRFDILKLTMAPGFMAAAFLCALLSLRYLPGRGRLNSTAYPAIVLLPLLLQILAAPLYNLSLMLFPPGELFYSLMETLKPTGHFLDTAGAILSIVLVGPICEEFVFRGVMMERALREGRNPHLIVFLQALLFGMAHMNPWQFFYAVTFGALFGYLRLWTGGILLTTLLHICVNGWSVLSMYVSLPLFQEADDGRPVPVEWPVVALALAIGAALVFALYRKHALPAHDIAA